MGSNRAFDYIRFDPFSIAVEIHDISAEYPEGVAFLAKAWDNYAKSNGVNQPNSATAYAKPVVGRKF